MKKLLVILALFVGAALLDKPEDHYWAIIDANGLISAGEGASTVERNSAFACSIPGGPGQSYDRFHSGACFKPDNGNWHYVVPAEPVVPEEVAVNKRI